MITTSAPESVELQSWYEIRPEIVKQCGLDWETIDDDEFEQLEFARLEPRFFEFHGCVYDVEEFRKATSASDPFPEGWELFYVQPGARGRDRHYYGVCVARDDGSYHITVAYYG